MISPIFSIVFNLIFLVFILVFRRKKLDVSTKDVLMLAFSVNRLARMVSYDKAMETYRSPFVKTVADESGAGETTEPKTGSGESIREVGALLSCPICIGTWIAALLTYGLILFPKQTRIFLTIFSTIGLGELLNSSIEFLEWRGQQAREIAGDEKKKKT